MFSSSFTFSEQEHRQWTPYKHAGSVKSASNRPGGFAAQAIAPGSYRDFDLFFTYRNEFLINRQGLRDLPAAPNAPGKYEERIEVSGTNCGPLMKTYAMEHKGGFDASWIANP